MLAVSGEEARHSSLLPARAMPCWLWPAYALQKGTALAKPISFAGRP